MPKKTAKDVSTMQLGPAWHTSPRTGSHEGWPSRAGSGADLPEEALVPQVMGFQSSQREAPLAQPPGHLCCACVSDFTRIRHILILIQALKAFYADSFMLGL